MERRERTHLRAVREHPARTFLRAESWQDAGEPQAGSLRSSLKPKLLC
jgi:hypothetical protein